MPNVELVSIFFPEAEPSRTQQPEHEFGPMENVFLIAMPGPTIYRTFYWACFDTGIWGAFLSHFSVF